MVFDSNPNSTCRSTAAVRSRRTSTTASPPEGEGGQARQADGALDEEGGGDAPGLGDGADAEGADREGAAPHQRVEAHHPAA